VFRRSVSSSSPTHWSKDFVEHLRTVHFALIVVSSGLILLVFSSKSYNARTAYRQIDEIIRLQHAWSPTWIGQHCRGVSRENGSYADASIPRREFESQHRISGMVRRVMPWRNPFAISPQFVKVKKPPKSTLMFVISSGDWGCWEKGWDPRELVSNPDFPPPFAEFPNTLSDVRIWWDNMAATHTFVIPESIAMEGSLFRAGSYEGPAHLTGAQTKDSLEEVELSINYEFLQHSPIGPEPMIKQDAFPFALVGWLSSGQEEAWYGAGETVWFPVATYREVQVDQGEMIKSFTNWHVGTFERSFGDLAQAAHEMEDINLDEVRKIISEEASKGNETFEAFGMKFPSGQITIWGSAILLSIQLYLFLYLKQLSGRLRSDDPGWDIPWIGMDHEFLWTRLVFFVTLVPLPCVAIAALGVRSARQMTLDHWAQTGMHWYADRMVFAKILGLSAFLVFSVILAAWSWKCRPRIELGATHCHPQLFE
jgi:hypothetical protein